MIKFIQKGAAFAGSLLFLFLAPASAQSFDGERAYKFLMEQCNLGTREPNSSGHKKAKIYFEDFLRKQKGVYSCDDFTYQDGTGKTLALTNFQVLFQGKGGKRRLFCAHWDSRPWADHDPDLTNRSRPILGANDGASGVAVLMELCILFSKNPPASSVEIVLFDGEDIGRDRNNEWCQGSKHFALKADPKNYLYAVLLDMIGDKDLEIKREANSQANAPWLVDRIWTAAKEVRADAFVDQIGPGIYDDHIPLVERGIPSADLIDFDYPSWHTLADFPDKCSPPSLQTVGNVLVKLAYEE